MTELNRLEKHSFILTLDQQMGKERRTVLMQQRLIITSLLEEKLEY